MCGRYTATFVDPQLIAERFGVRESAVPGETLGRFNVCPTEQVLAVCARPARRARCAGASCRRGRASCAPGPSRSTRAPRRCSTSGCSRR